ncbi:M20 metallopeptidase family protein [Sphingobacterium sp. SYP-B4668]|uniref:M20 metallopeptidase family protein n=1 Tax=Sphingobacterium sp. SYP-B4668 TaxID=2996035 RepID=UPI0022DD958F|nr:amidohydrolase [Sphingobacterium sp. SYP-B4668]
MDKLELKQHVSRLIPQVVRYRRHLHQYPELSFQEFNTSLYIKQQLTEMGLAYDDVANTGVLVRIEGQLATSDQVVIFRADMDALPIHEENAVAYHSQEEGIMHACGHDFHTANLLGVAQILKSIQHMFAGTFVLVFQPAEEKIPGGAVEVLRSTKLEFSGKQVLGMIGLHVSPRLKAGVIGLCKGRFMASSDEFYVRIKGRGGHGAEPHLTIDPVIIAAQLLTSLQHIVSRVANPAVPSVLSFGKIMANGAANVIPAEVYMEGTFRTFDEEWRERALLQIEKMIREMPVTLGAQVELEVRKGYPFLFNNVKLANQLEAYFLDYVGEEYFQTVESWMASEDFAYYTHRFPAVFYLIGVANAEKHKCSALHTSTFDVDEEAFHHAMGSMLYTGLSLLSDAVTPK